MKGSTMDAMSEAIEGSDVICYGVSLACVYHIRSLITHLCKYFT